MIAEGDGREASTRGITEASVIEAPDVVSLFFFLRGMTLANNTFIRFHYKALVDLSSENTGAKLLWGCARPPTLDSSSETPKLESFPKARVAEIAAGNGRVQWPRNSKKLAVTQPLTGRLRVYSTQVEINAL